MFLHITLWLFFFGGIQLTNWILKNLVQTLHCLLIQLIRIMLVVWLSQMENNTSLWKEVLVFVTNGLNCFLYITLHINSFQFNAIQEALFQSKQFNFETRTNKSKCIVRIVSTNVSCMSYFLMVQNQIKCRRLQFLFVYWLLVSHNIVI